jgi:hypothetical protein
MASEIVRLGRAAWERLKKGRASWGDWVLVGHALLEGRAIAMSNAGTVSPVGGGYACAFNDWLLFNRCFHRYRHYHRYRGVVQIQ